MKVSRDWEIKFTYRTSSLHRQKQTDGQIAKLFTNPIFSAPIKCQQAFQFSKSTCLPNIVSDSCLFWTAPLLIMECFFKGLFYATVKYRIISSSSWNRNYPRFSLKFFWAFSLTKIGSWNKDQRYPIRSLGNFKTSHSALSGLWTLLVRSLEAR